MAALLLALPAFGEIPFETCGQVRLARIGQRQPTASNAPPGRASDSRCTGAGECKGVDGQQNGWSERDKSMTFKVAK